MTTVCGSKALNKFPTFGVISFLLMLDRKTAYKILIRFQRKEE